MSSSRRTGTGREGIKGYQRLVETRTRDGTIESLLAAPSSAHAHTLDVMQAKW